MTANLFDRGVDSGASFSLDRVHRYTLWRRWDDTGADLVVIGLNPSTADETRNDPTIRRCIGFAKALGMGGFVMLNLFAFRATDPRVMKAAADPIGPMNDDAIVSVCWAARLSDGRIVAAWGMHGQFRGRGDQVRALVPGLECWGVTKGSSQPLHPLYLPATAELRPLDARQS